MSVISRATGYAPSSPPAAASLVEVGGGTAARRRRVQMPRWLRRLYGPIGLLVLWQILCSAGVLKPNLFPPPIDVWKAGTHLIGNGTLESNLWTSLRRVLEGLGFGITFGTILAVLAGLSRWGEDVIDSSVQVLKSVPVYALIPLFITWLGIDEKPKIVLIAVAVGLAIYVNTYSAIRGVDAQLVEVADTLEVSRWSLIANVILPGAMPGFLVGMRFALASAWLSLIFAETINTTSGIGYLMTNAEENFQLDVMVFIVIVYAAVGLAGYGIVKLLERRLLSWRNGYAGA
jgi:sulfonate transport system permease protein